MIDYKVGVQVQKTYELFEIDNDFFDLIRKIIKHLI
jgi:restriction system protein